MFDKAAIFMNKGDSFSLERMKDVNTNMSQAHSHPYYELYYLLDGERIQVIDGKITRITKNEFVVIGPNVKHFSYGEKDIAFDRVLIYFTKDIFSSSELEKSFSPLLNNGFSAKESSLTRSYILELMNLALLNQNKLEKEKFKLIFNLLLISIIDLKDNILVKNTDMTALNIMAYIDKNYNKQITLDDIANQIYLNKYYMCKKFKKLTTYTIFDYLNTTRLTVAEKQLMETDKSITQISEEVGFNNLVSFNRAFKSKNKVSPSEFRKINNNSL